MSLIDEAENRDETASADSLLIEWAAELAVKIRDSQNVDWDEIAQGHPEHAQELRRMLPAFALLANAGSSAHRDSATDCSIPHPLGEPGRLGDYRLLREVGRGGMGVVYEGYQISLKRRVALKVLPVASRLDARQLQRFEIEARAAGALHHANIVPVFAVGTERGVPFYAMQFIEGRTLAEVIREMRRLDGLDPTGMTPVSELTYLLTRGRLSPMEGEKRESHRGKPAVREESLLPAIPVTQPGGRISRQPDFIRTVARLGIQAADALEHAHGRGILHRDIKPSNLLVDRAGHLWVTDFGLARIPGESNLTLTGDVLGTLRYMSPEQALGKRRMLDESSDVYSLGATLYELLTLRPAFAGDDRQEVLRSIAEEEPCPPRRFNPAVPRALETIVLKSMARQPARRYGTAEALRDDLQRFLDGRPILGRRSSAWARALSWARLRPAVAALMALVVLLVCGMVGGIALWASWLSWHNRQLEIHIARANLKAAEAERAQQIAEERQHQADRHRHAASLRRAREALDARQFELAQDILHEIWPELTDKQAAGFAWGYLWQRATRDFTQLWGHESRVMPPVISADGRTLATRDITGSILVWTLNPDQAPDRPRASLTAPRVNPDDLAVSLSPDGRLLALASPGSPTGSVQVFDTHSGSPVTGVLGEASKHVVACSFDPAGQRILVVVHPNDGPPVVRWWDLARPQAEPCGWKLDKDLYLLGISAARGYLAGSTQKNIQLHDLWTGKLRLTIADSELSSSGLNTLHALSVDGHVLGAHTRRDRFVVWETGSGRELGQFDVADTFHVELGSSRARIAVMNEHGRVTVFDPARKQTSGFSVRGGEHTVRGCSLAFSWDDALLATLSDRAPGGPQSPEIWDIEAPRRLRVFPGRRDIDRFAFVPGRRSVVVTGGTRPRIWRIDPIALPDALAGHTAEAWSAAFSPNGKLLATGSDDTGESQTIKLWDPLSGKLLAGWKAHAATVGSLAFSPDGCVLASASLGSGTTGNPNVRVWDVATRTVLAGLPDHEGRVRAVAFSPDGRILASAGDDGSPRLWDTATYTRRAILAGHAARATCLAFSPDSSRLASGSCDTTVRIWDVSTGESRAVLKHSGNVHAVAFAPSATLLAAASEDGQIKLWNYQTGDPLLTIHSAADQLRCLAFSPDGRYVTASGIDKVIRLWDIATGQEVLSLVGHASQVNALAYSPDGSLLVSCSHDGAVRLWRAQSIGSP
jgi:WD40 repeat protein/serine/threonine protein kinase